MASRKQTQKVKKDEKLRSCAEASYRDGPQAAASRRPDLRVLSLPSGRAGAENADLHAGPSIKTVMAELA